MNVLVFVTEKWTGYNPTLSHCLFALSWLGLLESLNASHQFKQTNRPRRKSLGQHRQTSAPLETSANRRPERWLVLCCDGSAVVIHDQCWRTMSVFILWTFFYFFLLLPIVQMNFPQFSRGSVASRARFVFAHCRVWRYPYVRLFCNLNRVRCSTGWKRHWAKKRFVGRIRNVDNISLCW